MSRRPTPKDVISHEQNKARGLGYLLWPVVVLVGVIGWVLWKWYALPLAAAFFVLVSTAYSVLAHRRLRRVTGPAQSCDPQREQRVSHLLGDTEALEASLSGDLAAFKAWDQRQESRERARDELLDMCEHAPALREVMARHGTDRRALRELYDLLLEVGAGQWRGGYFVPLATLLRAAPLDYALTTLREHKGHREAQEEMVYNLLMYFQQTPDQMTADLTDTSLLWHAE